MRFYTNSKDIEKKRRRVLNFRNNVLESQKRANYINEYDRLRGAMKGLVSETSKQFIHQRMERLKELASEPVHGKRHAIFISKEEEATKRNKQRARQPDTQETENARRALVEQTNELASNLAARHRIAERRARQ